MKKQLIDEKIIESLTNYDDLFLLRFCRARKFDIKKVHEMFTNYIKWRKDENVDEIENFQFTEQLQIKEVYPHGYHKVDKYGRPIYIEILSKLNLDEVLRRSNENNIKKYFIKEYERTIKYRLNSCTALSGKIIEQSCTLVCLKDWGISKVTGKVKNFMNIASTIGQNYYPEMLGNMYILNTGFWFSAIWAIAKTFIDERIAKKISFLGADYLIELEKHIDLNNLPKILGGNCECNNIPGGCLYSDIGPWNPDGGLDLIYNEGKFWRVR